MKQDLQAIALQELPAYKRDPAKILRVGHCKHCGGEFHIAKKFPDAKFCSRKCGLAATLPADHNARTSRDSAVKRGDTQRGRGAGKTYRKLNGRHEHRVIAEEKLGRPLLPGEIVHHADENIRNNDPSNLDILPSQAEHARLHFKGKRLSPDQIRRRSEARRRATIARAGAT